MKVSQKGGLENVGVAGEHSQIAKERKSEEREISKTFVEAAAGASGSTDLGGPRQVRAVKLSLVLTYAQHACHLLKLS